MSMMTKAQLVNELYVHSKSLNNVYAPPEAAERAQKFISMVEKDLGLTMKQILDNPDLLDPILEARAQSYQPKFTGRLVKVISSHNNLPGDEFEGGFDHLPEVDCNFELMTRPFGAQRMITTSRVQSVDKLSDTLYEIRTRNSTYRLEVNNA